LNPRVDTHTGSPDRETAGGVGREHMSYPLELLKYTKEYESLRDTVARIVVEGNRISIEFSSPDDVRKFIDFIQALGVTGNIEKKELKIEYDVKFWDYLTKDRQLDLKTAKDYMNYLKKLNGKVIDYNLYLEIAGNKWKVKLVRLYLDYLYKTGRVSWEEKERLKSIFKVKKNNDGNDEYKIDVDNLVERTITMREGLYRLILELLLYSGARLSEVVRMLREWSEDRLECYDDFCRYRLKWFRGRKRSDYIFFPSRLLQGIMKYAHKVGRYDNLRKNIYDYYKIKTKDFRKLHYRLCRSILDKEVCAFFQSRIASLDVSDRHYDELLTRATESYPNLAKKIDEFVERVKELMSDGVPIREVEVEGFVDDEGFDGEERLVWEFRF